MPVIIVVVSSGFFIYWLFRAFLLAFGEPAVIWETMEEDFWWWRRVIHVVRGLLVPPTEIG